MSTKKNASSTKSESKPTLVPKLRFPEFRGTEGWELKPMGMYLRESRIAGSKGNVARKITVRLWGNGVFEKKESVQGSINTQYYRRRAGQFIYSKLDFLNQAFGIVPEDLDGYESTVDLPCFDVSAELNPVFLLEYVKRKEFYERVGEAADGSRKAKRIQVETFLECPIAIASRAEQQKIASCLSSLDDLITAQAKKIDLLKTYKKGLMQQLFPREGETQPRLRFPEFRGNGEWKVRTLGEVCAMQAGKFIAADEINEQFADGLFPCYGGNGLRGYTVAYTHNGTYPLIGRQGALCGNVKLVNGRFHATEHAVVASAKQGVEVVWLYYALAQLRLNRFATGQAQPGLSVDSLEKVSVPVAIDQHEQQRIATTLSSLDDLIAAQCRKLASIKTHKNGLMRGLFPTHESM